MSQANDLLRLQELDLEYSRLKHSAETLPQKEKINAARAATKKVNSELTKIVGMRKDLEIEINELEVHKQYVSAKVTEVQNADATSYRDTKNLDSSLSSLAKKLEKIDYQNNQLLAKLDKAEQAEKNARSLSAKLAAEEQDQTLAYKLELEKIAKQVQAITLERSEVASKLSEETLSSYEVARKRFGGIAVETLEGNRPSACRVNLQPSSYSDLRRSHQEITTCPYCKRMLVLSFDE